ncbi:hypothetical protein Tco_0294866 [Tanacetum coccineum]
MAEEVIQMERDGRAKGQSTRQVGGRRQTKGRIQSSNSEDGPTVEKWRLRSSEEVIQIERDGGAKGQSTRQVGGRRWTRRSSSEVGSELKVLSSEAQEMKVTRRWVYNSEDGPTVEKWRLRSSGPNVLPLSDKEDNCINASTVRRSSDVQWNDYNMSNGASSN